MIKNKTTNLVMASMFVAIGIFLPSIFHFFNMAGPIFLPMHIPVILCGLVCGWRYGLIVGFIVPLLSSVLTGMPILFPVGIAMSFELATYGAICGIFKEKFNVFIILIAAMLCGRIISAIATFLLLGFSNKPFILSAFLTTSFVRALPGIIVQLVCIPLILGMVKNLQNAKNPE